MVELLEPVELLVVSSEPSESLAQLQISWILVVVGSEPSDPHSFSAMIRVSLLLAGEPLELQESVLAWLEAALELLQLFQTTWRIVLRDRRIH